MDCARELTTILKKSLPREDAKKTKTVVEERGNSGSPQSCQIELYVCH